MSDIFGKLKSGAGKVAFEADKMARVNRVQGEIGNLKKQMDSQYMRLGDLTYRSFVNNEPASPEVQDVCQAITNLMQQIAEHGEEVKCVQAEQFAQPAPTPQPAAQTYQPNYGQAPPPPPAQGAKFCPSCGKQAPSGVKFCPECGAKLS